MPTSVVDQIFARHEAVDATGVRVKAGGPLDPNVRGRGVQKASRPPRSNFPTSIMDITTNIKVEKAVTALGTIEVCNKRQAQLAAQLTPLPEVAAAFRGMGSNEPVRDRDEVAVYEEERARLQSIRDGAVDVLDELFGAEVGPPLNLQAAVQQRKAVAAQQALEAQMGDMAMRDAPESPNAVYASTSNPRFRSIGTDD